ncbi:glycosyltransferase [Vibrio owensii]|uniref:glycosyltransferase n=1 Tax=Vibrio owensii TaxID=696485 RepID=UPI001048F4D5|nr:glycosyltransferase [Vibrio owensii]TDE21641.1 glycosyltransferase [Vibrio owensii]
MKLCFFLPSLANRGPNVFTLNLVRSLIENGYVSHEDVTVLYFKKDPKPLSFPCKTSKIKFLDMFNLKEFDILHSTMFLPDIFLSFLSFFRNGLVCGVHNEIRLDTKFLYGKYKGFIISRVWEFALGRFNRLVVSSKKMQCFYEKLGVRTESVIIPYGVPDSLSDSTYAAIPPEIETLEFFKKNYTVIGSCGLFIERKNQSILIDLLALYPDYALILIGDGPLDSDLKKQAEKLGVSNRILFTGFVDNSNQYYKFMDVYASPSFSEGFGLAMLNAISLGIPICVSNLDIYNGFFDESNTGLFEPDSIESLAYSLKIVTKNIQYFSNCSEKLYSQFFSLKAMGDLHYNFYKELLFEGVDK